MDAIDILKTISTRDIIYDDEYTGYLYRIKDNIMNDPYKVFIINIMSSIKHVSTDTMRTLVVRKKEPYLYFSRTQKSILYLQYELLKILKDVDVPREAIKFIDMHVDMMEGIKYFHPHNLRGIFMRHVVMTMLKDVPMNNINDVFDTILDFKRGVSTTWLSLKFPPNSYSLLEKTDINNFFNAPVFKGIEYDYKVNTESLPNIFKKFRWYSNAFE